METGKNRFISPKAGRIFAKTWTSPRKVSQVQSRSP